MKPLALFAIALTLAHPALAQDNPPPPAKDLPAPGEKAASSLPEKQKALLARRTNGALAGTFEAYASLLYAVHDVIIGSDDEAARKTRLESPYPEFYQPTYAELFEVIARQTKTSWIYDAKNGSWNFTKPTLPLPFTIEVAKGWQSENRGKSLFCKPPGAKVGMDVYVLGSFSAEPPDAGLADKMREAAALLFAQNFKKDVTVKDMTKLKVGDYEALHFTAPAPKAGVTWRQWAIASGGRSIVIVSAIDAENEKTVLPEVEAMGKTLKIIPVK